MIKLDGSTGEGGGQILRTALSLSMVTGMGFRIDHIRAKRPKPGLLRQHLTAVNAAAEICNAQVDGAVPGSLSLHFVPGAIKAGEYKFAVGSAGSCTLVFQTVLPALMLASTPSRVIFEGGTHNGMAPPFQFIERAFLPQLKRMGVIVDARLERFGFYPAGGGRFVVDIHPVASLASSSSSALATINIESRGANVDGFAESFIAGVPGHVAQRELAAIGQAMSWPPDKLLMRGINDAHGPGNVVLITLAYEHITEVFAGFGERGVSAEAVAQRVIDEARRYMASGAAVSEHLADQLMLPFALAGSGMFTAAGATQHARTNADVIQKFLAVDIAITPRGTGAGRGADRDADRGADTNAGKDAVRFTFSR